MDAKERFYRKFQSEVADIQDHIGRLGAVAIVGGERKDASDSILASLSQLSLEVADAAEFIPAYDQRTYSNTVKSLTDRLNDELARLAPPKPRFQFKKSAKAAASAASAPAKADHRLLRGVPDAKAPADASVVSSLPDSDTKNTKNYNAGIAASSDAIRRPSFSSAKEINIAGHTGLHIILPLSASRATASGSLTDLAGCAVDMSVPTSSEARGGGGAAFQSLMLRNIERSLVVVGHVSGPVHMTKLKNCVLVVASRQVRIHECYDVDIYLDVRSRPIIEDCKNMRFAPLPSTYSDRTDGSANQWDQVDDFKWLRAEPSPNWSVLPEAERLPESVWTDAVRGTGRSTEDVLKAVGI
ncbi:tubulin-specific chaperone c [Ophiostoma piceae UAMH 11346]|uniref:Tubulin-specific chaperone c n=1 Tax=Ophiostoma piceae (strain UAMH 11346) TaxID=1262450 RepID=S3BPS4_OPHP1|nr:tubulin-specific chaperone c [Ophiostoma piceae UAMH 11346]